MNFEQIVEKVCASDKRNKFAISYAKNPELPQFYHIYDPIDVEFDSPIGVIRMFSIDEIKTEAVNYSYVAGGLIFATSNGDPLFIKNNLVYICDHGSKNPTYEKLANSFEEFIKNII